MDQHGPARQPTSQPSLFVAVSLPLILSLANISCVFVNSRFNQTHYLHNLSHSFLMEKTRQFFRDNCRSSSSSRASKASSSMSDLPTAIKAFKMVSEQTESFSRASKCVWTKALSTMLQGGRGKGDEAELVEYAKALLSKGFCSELGSLSNPSAPASDPAASSPRFPSNLPLILAAETPEAEAAAEACARVSSSSSSSLSSSSSSSSSSFISTDADDRDEKDENDYDSDKGNNIGRSNDEYGDRDGYSVNAASPSLPTPAATAASAATRTTHHHHSKSNLTPSPLLFIPSTDGIYSSPLMIRARLKTKIMSSRFRTPPIIIPPRMTQIPLIPPDIPYETIHDHRAASTLLSSGLTLQPAARVASPYDFSTSPASGMGKSEAAKCCEVEGMTKFDLDNIEDGDAYVSCPSFGITDANQASEEKRRCLDSCRRSLWANSSISGAESTSNRSSQSKQREGYCGDALQVQRSLDLLDSFGETY